MKIYRLYENLFVFVVLFCFVFMMSCANPDIVNIESNPIEKPPPLGETFRTGHWKKGKWVAHNDTVYRKGFLQKDTVQMFIKIAYPYSVYSENKSESLTSKIIKRYPLSDGALFSRSWILKSEFYLQSMDLRSVGDIDLKIRLDLYKGHKKFLEYHRNSPILLFDLCNLGYPIYPEEVVIYANRAIDKYVKQNYVSIGEFYLMSGRGYQILGEYDKALEKLEAGKKFLTKRLVTELRKKYPYRSVDGSFLNVSDINRAKSYLREMGYNPGKDYSPRKPGLIQRMFNFGKPADMKVAYGLHDKSSTSIKDLYLLDQVIYVIDMINSGTPIWGPEHIYVVNYVR